MTNRHTPGPWFPGDRYTPYNVHDGSGRGICSTGGYSDNTLDGDELIAENTANAHLIAAASDMYDALKAVAERDTLSGHYGELDWLIDDARVAIAKARGKS